MKKLIFLLLAVMMLTACGQDKENDQGAVYVNITAEEAKKIMDTEEGYNCLWDSFFYQGRHSYLIRC